MKIVVYNNKGGVGKSTLTAHVGFLSAENGIECTVIDADSQNNTMSWLAGNNWNGDTEYRIGTVTVTTDARADGNLVIVDAPPAFSFAQNYDGHVDLWVIPVTGRFSIDGAINVISQVRSSKSSARIVLVNNMADTTTRFGKIESKQLLDLGVELFQMPIPRNTIIRKAEMLGKSVWKTPYGNTTDVARSLREFGKWVLVDNCSKDWVIE